jgi:hypothetical protein
VMPSVPPNQRLTTTRQKCRTNSSTLWLEVRCIAKMLWARSEQSRPPHRWHCEFLPIAPQNLRVGAVLKAPWDRCRNVVILRLRPHVLGARAHRVARGVPLPEMSEGGSLGHGAGLTSLQGGRSADLGQGAETRW